MGQEAPNGVTADTSRDGAVDVPPRDDSFWSNGRKLAVAFGFGRPVTVRVWADKGAFEVVLGDLSGPQTMVWLSDSGLEGLIGELQATLVRSRIERGD